jgi:hypothetical protein
MLLMTEAAHADNNRGARREYRVPRGGQRYYALTPFSFAFQTHHSLSHVKDSLPRCRNVRIVPESYKPV